MMKSIRTRILVINLTAILLFALLIGSMGVITVGELSENESKTSLELMCNEKKANLDSIFRCVEHSVRIVVRQAQEELNSGATEGITEEYTEHMRRLFENIALDTRGAIGYYIRYNPEFYGPTAGFFWSKESGENEFVKYECTDLSLYEKTDMEHVGWYYVPVEAGEAVWVEPYMNRNNNMFMCSYVVPYYDNGTLIGIIGMDVDIASIIRMINESNVYESGYGYLVNDDNKIVFHKDYETGASRPLLTKNQIEDQVTLENGLTLVMTVDKSEVYMARNSLLNHIVAMVIVATLLFTVVSILLTTHITKPIIALSNAVKNLERGEYNISLDTERKDEIGVLTKNFVATSKYIKNYTSYINSLAYRDSLTGLKNATAYQEVVDILENRMKNGFTRYGLVIFDVNSLKQTNDKYGHESGNALLIAASQLICSVFEHSPVFRIGGDEFAVYLENTDYENREALLARFDEEMKKAVFEAQEKVLPVSVARGMAVCDEGTDREYSDVFQRADEAMYANKEEVKHHLPS